MTRILKTIFFFLLFTFTLAIPLMAFAAPSDHEGHEMPAGHEHHHPSAAEMPDDVKPSDGSVYWLDGTWTTQRGKVLVLKSFEGKPVLLLMAYTSCKAACPMLIEDLKRTQSKLSAAERAGLQILFVTLDPEHDTPVAMAAFQKKIPSAKDWIFLQGSDDQVLELGSVLGVRFRKVDDGYLHSNKLTVLSRKGEVAYQAIGLNAPEKDTVAAIRKVQTK